MDPCFFSRIPLKVKSLSHVWLCELMDCSLPGSSIHGFPRQEYWSGVPLPSPHPYISTREAIFFTRWTFVSKVMSLLFNMLSRLVIAFLLRSKHLLILWLQWLWNPQNKASHCFHCFPISLPWSDGTRCHDLHFLNVVRQLFHSPLSPSSRGSLVALHFLP